MPKGMDPKGTSVNDNSAQCTVGISIKGIPDPPKPRPVHTYELPFNCPYLPFCSTLSMLLFEFQVYGILQGDCGRWSVEEINAGLSWLGNIDFFAKQGCKP